jgi:hypothetical protein
MQKVDGSYSCAILLVFMLTRILLLGIHNLALDVTKPETIHTAVQVAMPVLDLPIC